MEPIHFASAVLFVLTALLLLTAEFWRANAIGRVAALLAFVTVLGADVLLMSNVPEIGRLWEPSGKPPPKKNTARQSGGGGSANELDPKDLKDADDGDGGGSHHAGGGGGGSDTANMIAAKVSSWLKPRPQAPSRVPGDTIRDCPDCPEMVVLPSGMARNAETAAPMRDASASPREVRIWPGFAIGRLELGRAEFARFIGATGHPAKVCSGTSVAAVLAAHGGAGAVAPEPLVGAEVAACVTWDDAIAYVTWLSAQTGRRYRLATATEWLYAADVAKTLADGPRNMGTGVAEIVSDCWRGTSGVLAVAYRRDPVCVTHTVVDVPPEADASGGALLPRIPLAADARSAAVGLRIARDLD